LAHQDSLIGHDDRVVPVDQYEWERPQHDQPGASRLACEDGLDLLTRPQLGRRISANLVANSHFRTPVLMVDKPS
jgi:hypothetical protein